MAQTTNTTFPAFWPKVKIQMPGKQSDFVLSVSCPFWLYPSAVTGFRSSGISYVNGYHNSCETRKKKKERRTKGTNEGRNEGRERQSERGKKKKKKG